MTDTPQFTGADLARMALANARAAAPKNPSGPTRTKPKKTARRGTGRDPVSLGSAIAALGAEVPMEAGVAGGSLMDQWPTLCPQYAGLVQPIRYDEQTGRLDLRPGTHSHAAQLRILGGQLAKQINDKMGRPVVRTIRVLPVGNLTTTTAAAVPDQPDPEAPVRTREDGCPGYQNTRAIVLEHQPAAPPADPYVEQAMRRQEAALRANRQQEPPQIGESVPAARVDRSEQVRRAALARKRQEQAGGEQLPRRAFDAA